jgi:hypothetical protein
MAPPKGESHYSSTLRERLRNHSSSHFSISQSIEMVGELPRFFLYLGILESVQNLLRNGFSFLKSLKSLTVRNGVYPSEVISQRPGTN